MKTQHNRPRPAWFAVVGAAVLLLSGCSTLGGTAVDLGLAGTGGVAGYHLANEKIGGAAAGAALGLVGSRVAQAQVGKALSEAEARGYDRALNQAVKQHYWVLQAQQRTQEDQPERETRLVPVVIPESSINGVIQKPRIEYLRQP